ncbi:uncharacterized protein CLUP02_15803 [Colletotrichum lupini]|uniref:Uncharacterized protein n=1 Tax=Colletotrichum lupini TaxID=145971 RepID=A0A9Q8T7D9_9PEZI|nr:uncharacterized protein CLUP02_15803 [Colletotrichum lupini]UQC90273.1 hypothetical protein CLUP02_15803 [Colletotrichum lupini]
MASMHEPPCHASNITTNCMMLLYKELGIWNTEHFCNGFEALRLLPWPLSLR